MTCVVPRMRTRQAQAEHGCWQIRRRVPVIGMSNRISSSRASAERRLYDAEVALHIARQSGVDEWTKAASERLHEAIVAYRSTLSAVDAACARSPRSDATWTPRPT